MTIKRRTISIAIIVLSMLIVGLAVWGGMARLKKPVVGTYCTENSMGGGIYVAVYSDNNFLIYRQFERLVEGSFRVDEFGDIVAVTFTGDDGQTYVASFDNRDSLVFIGEFVEGIEESILLTRISDVPTLINVND